MAERVAQNGSGLTLRLIVLLTLALLPLGAIAYWQNARILQSADLQSDLSLLARTERAANVIQSRLQRALGHAESIGILFEELLDDLGACSEYLAAFAGSQPAYTLIGLVPPDGRMTCSSRGRPFDFSGTPGFQRSVEDPRTEVVVNPAAPITGRAVMIVSVPVRRDGEFLGFVTMSVPVDSLAATSEDRHLRHSRALGLTTVNARGEVLTSTFGGNVAAQLPAPEVLADLMAGPRRVLAETGPQGERRTYAVSPLAPGVAYAVGTFSGDVGEPDGLELVLRSGAIPLAMWVASLLVAVLALHMMVVRRIRGLSKQMRTFAGSRRMVEAPEMRGAPAELRAIERDFKDMATSILQDEATLEDNLREKNVLLKEVHHRVKNNLQLISSIVNMEGRRVANPAAGGLLERLQDRILGLALVHRALYGSDDLHRVDAGRLLEAIVAQAGDGEIEGIAPTLSVTGEAALDPDTAVPLALLTSEALTNAERHGGGGAAVTFEARDNTGHLRVENTVSLDRGTVGTMGLGTQLIRAFARQLLGEVRIGPDAAGNHVVDLRFPLETDKQPSKDY